MSDSYPAVKIYSFREIRTQGTWNVECRHFHRYSLNYGSDSRRCVAKYVAFANGPHTCENFVCSIVTNDQDNLGENEAAWQILTDEELLNEKLTTKNAPQGIRAKQATQAKKAGFVGPIKGGEARAMAGILREMGKADNVRRLFVYRQVTRVRYPGTSWERKWTIDRLIGPVYAFKPFLEGYSFEDFIRVVRMLRPGAKNARQAIREAIENPTMRDDLEMLKGLDVLCNLKGGSS